jgi:hypothetical protein
MMVSNVPPARGIASHDKRILPHRARRPPCRRDAFGVTKRE